MTGAIQSANGVWQRFVHFGTPPDPAIIIPAQHPAIGNIVIWDDGDEVTLEIGDITYGHFGAYDMLGDAIIDDRQ